MLVFKIVESLQCILNAVMGRVRLIIQYLRAFSITICLLGFGTHSADRQTQSGVWIVVNVCLEPQWHRLITEKKEKKEKD